MLIDAHPNIRLVFEHWRSLCRGRPMPDRHEIDPSKIASALPMTFILQKPLDVWTFRLVGEGVSGIFDKSIAGEAVDRVFQTRAPATLLSVRVDAVSSSGDVLGAAMAGSGVDDYTCVIMPLTVNGAGGRRALGVFEPRAGTRDDVRIDALRVVTTCIVATSPPPVTRLPPRLRVIQGGRSA